MLTWWSIYAASLPALFQVTAHPVYRFLPPIIGILSPSFITYLLFKLSGIPLLEKKQKKAYGDNPEFQQYVKNTPLLVPWPKIFASIDNKSDKQL
jgi:steroid 5-alpha reductase family enzyme